MTDPRPICPIPPDAKVGDVVVLRDGRRKEITNTQDILDVTVSGLHPGWLRRDGSSGCYDNADYECIAFEYADGRKSNLPSTEKPKRTQAQRDAARFAKMVLWMEGCRVSGIYLTSKEIAFLRKIADRLEKQP